MATDTLPTNSSAWPQVGNPPPNALSPTDPNPEWEMVADDTTNNNTANSGSDVKTNTNDNDHVVILPADIETSIKSSSNKNKIKGRPRSATIGGSTCGQIISTPTRNKSTTQPTNNTPVIRVSAATCQVGRNVVYYDDVHRLLIYS